MAVIVVGEVAAGVCDGVAAFVQAVGVVDVFAAGLVGWVMSLALGCHLCGFESKGGCI